MRKRCWDWPWWGDWEEERCCLGQLLSVSLQAVVMEAWTTSEKRANNLWLTLRGRSIGALTQSTWWKWPQCQALQTTVCDSCTSGVSHGCPGINLSANKWCMLGMPSSGACGSRTLCWVFKSTFQGSMKGIRSKPRVLSETEEYAQGKSREGVISRARDACLYFYFWSLVKVMGLIGSLFASCNGSQGMWPRWFKGLTVFKRK